MSKTHRFDREDRDGMPRHPGQIRNRYRNKDRRTADRAEVEDQLQDAESVVVPRAVEMLVNRI
jgi:hypothetical protein